MVSDRIFCDKSGVPSGDRPLLKEPPVSDRLSGGAYRAHDAFGGTADTASVESDLAFVGTIFMIAGTLLQRADFFDRDWNLWVIIGILVFYLSLSRANPGINMSVREYGVYQAFSVPFFILIGITGSMLCIWVGKSIPELHCGYGVSLYRAEYDCSSGASYSRT